MANKRPTPKRPQRAHPSARRAGAPVNLRRGPWFRMLHPDWMLLLLLGLSLAIRLWGIHDRLPDSSLGINVLDDSVVEETDRTTMGRAWMLWRGGTKVDMNPHTGGWPALNFYLTLGLQYLYKTYHTLVAGGATPEQFQQHVAGAGAGPMFLFARIAGALIGLAGACKYVPLVLALPLALAHIIRGRGVKRASIFKNRALWAGMLAILAALFVATPFLFVDWKRTVIDIAGQRRALFSDWVGQTVFPISLSTYLAVTLLHAMGWPTYLMGLFGMVLLWREGRVKRTLVWVPALIVLVNGMLKSPQERYVLVALPFLHVAAAFAIVRGAAWARSR